MVYFKRQFFFCFAQMCASLRFNHSIEFKKKAMELINNSESVVTDCKMTENKKETKKEKKTKNKTQIQRKKKEQHWKIQLCL